MTLVSIPSNPVPEGAVSGTIRTRDGRTLRFARWPPPPGRKGTVCLFTGRSEFIEKYFEVVCDARARGFAVAMIDWRGQGLSDRVLRDRRKGHVGDFAEYAHDIDALMKEVVLPDCPPPYFALGHSMGATVLIRAARMGQRWFERSVLCAPMIALAGRGATWRARMTIDLMRRAGLGRAYVPGGGATASTLQPFAGNPLTSDAARYARLGALIAAEPKLGLGAPTVSWLAAAYRAMDEFAAPDYPRTLRHPMLIVAAGQDAVVSTPAIEQFAMRLRTGAHLLIAGARHEILMEKDNFRGQFWAAFEAFIPGTPTF